MRLNLWKRRAEWMTVKGWPVTVNVALLLITTGVMCIAAHREQNLRLWGLALQLGGIATVGWDLAKLYRRFYPKGLRAAAREWFVGWRKEWPRTDVSVGLTGLAVEVNGSLGLRADLQVGPPAGASLDERMARLEEKMLAAESRLTHLRNALEDERQARDRALQQVVARLEELAEALGAQIKDTATGSAAPLLWGALWLAVGVVLSTATHELHCALLALGL